MRPCISYYSLASNKFFWLKEVLMHPGINACWRAAFACESMCSEELQELAKRKLQKVLAHAVTTVPYYQRYFSGHDITNLKLTDFPIVEKKDVRGHEQDFVSNAAAKKNLRWTRTSGSTGEPFRFARSEYECSYADLWRGLYRFGIRPGDKRVLVKGVDETANISLKTKISRGIYGWINRCIVVDAHFLAKSEASILAELKRIVQYNPDYFHGYVSSIYLLARTAEEKGIDLSSLHVKAVVTESEKCYPFQRELIERIFNTPVVENYGCVEVGMIAQPDKDGRLRINEDHVIVESGEDGGAIITNLDEFSFPLIRYHNGDMLKLSQAIGPLPYSVISSLDGRKTEMIKLPGGSALQGFIVMYPMYKHTDYLRAYQIYQPDLSHLIIRMSLWREMPESVLRQIKTEMQELVGADVSIETEFWEKIPLSKRGKRLFVCSDVK